MSTTIAVYFVAAALYMWHETYSPKEAVERALELWQAVIAEGRVK